MWGFFKKKDERSEKTAEVSSKERVSINQALQAINDMQRQLDKLKLSITSGDLSGAEYDESTAADQALAELKKDEGAVHKNENEKIIEGVFDGQNMIGADGEQYDVPANYASKSKLVEGDILKLTINNLGAFVYKQIKPIERLRMVGRLEQDEQSLQYYAVAEGKKWKLITASVTYYKGEPGDEVVFLIPAEGGSRWAAVENIVRE